MPPDTGWKPVLPGPESLRVHSCSFVFIRVPKANALGGSGNELGSSFYA